METKLSLITRIAKSDKDCKFNNLMHMINKDSLRECFKLLTGNKAAGVDRVTKEEYGMNLEENLNKLVVKMKQMSYRPQACRRTYIPKVGGKLRPLGIPALEDKMVQMAFSRILEAIFEVDFCDNSYGYRKGRSCHDALARINSRLMVKPVNYIVDADIKGFFDNVDHQWLIRFLEVRVADKKFLRYITRFLKSGVMEEGKYMMMDGSVKYSVYIFFSDMIIYNIDKNGPGPNCGKLYENRFYIRFTSTFHCGKRVEIMWKTVRKC